MYMCPICKKHYSECKCVSTGGNMKTKIWMCPICGTNYNRVDNKSPFCQYCAEQEAKENKLPDSKLISATKPSGIPYNTLWRGFWAGVEKIDRVNYSKSELLNIKEFFEGMVSDGK